MTKFISLFRRGKISPALFLILGVTMPLSAAPFLPDTDAQVLEQLPVKNTAVDRELGLLKTSLKQNPEDLQTAIAAARRYVEIGRRESDPRYSGYAQAALAPWWNRADAPVEVRVLRATLAQSSHQFDAALAELNSVLRQDKTHPQAWLTRASILQVQGRFAEAKQACQVVARIASPLVAQVCSTGVANVNGEALPSYQRLLHDYARYGEAEPDLRSWVLTQLAEMAARLGKSDAAETQFRAALKSDPDDSYLLAAYADYLLDQKRYAEVSRLLQDKIRADGLLLRYAEALKRTGHAQAKQYADKLQQRFASAALRGDRTHQREQARFTLHLLNDAPSALQLALENWRVQKEPADLRVLLEAAVAASDTAAISLANEWIKQSGLQDVALAGMLPANPS